MSISALAGPAILTEAEVIRIAEAAAKKEGRDLHDYERKTPHYEPEHIKDIWFILYEGKHGYAGDHFGVIIEDKTQKTHVLGGS